MLIDAMPQHPGWMDIAIRIILTIAAGALIGVDRQTGGHSAGLRTSILVGLAACLSMVQANILLSVTGKTFQSFSQMDVLRLPLGVLTGVGFIGGGAILKRGDIVTGVTTAASMWVMTAIGLCFGGGQALLGCAATAIAVTVLWPLERIDRWMPHEQKGYVVINLPQAEDRPEIAGLLQNGIKIRFRGKRKMDDERFAYSYDLRWKALDNDDQAERVLRAIEERYSVAHFEVADETE